MSIAGFKNGFVFGYPSIAMGISMEFDHLRPKGSIEGISSQLYYLGFGVGAGNDTRFELSAEVDPISKISSHIPIKVSFVLESKFSSFSLGYKGSWYQGKYIDLDQIVQSKLVYNHNDDSRLEHNINISVGNTKGFDWAWVAIYTETENHSKSNLFGGNETHPTYTKAFSLVLKMGYLF